MRTPDPEYMVPLSPIHYQILVALIDRPTHGYGLKENIRQDSEGIMQLGTSTIYVALKSLSLMGYVEIAGKDAGTGSPHARIKYYLTRTGRFVLEQETNRLRDAITLARHRLKAGA